MTSCSDASVGGRLAAGGSSGLVRAGHSEGAGSFGVGLRADGRGGAIYDPEAMLAAVLLSAYCTGERSSRRIERRLV